MLLNTNYIKMKRKKTSIKFALDVDIVYDGFWKPGCLIDKNGRSYFPIGNFKTNKHQTNIAWILEIPNNVSDSLHKIKSVKLMVRSDISGIYDPFKDASNPPLMLHVRPAEEKKTFKYRKSSFSEDLVSIQVSTKDTELQKHLVDITHLYDQKEFWVVLTGGSHIYLHPQLYFNC